MRILLVEDEVLIAENLKQGLESQGFEVVMVCHNYQDTIAAWDGLEFDIAIFDINLGGEVKEEGIMLAENYRSKFSKPFLFLTAYSDGNTVSKAASLNPEGYLVKPVNDSTLFTTLQLAMHKHYSDEKPPVDISDSFFVQLGKKKVKVAWASVYKISVERNYVEVEYAEQSKCILRTSLKNFLSNQLPQRFKDSFIQINRSCLVRKEDILSFNDKTVTTRSGTFNISGSAYQSLCDGLTTKLS